MKRPASTRTSWTRAPWEGRCSPAAPSSRRARAARSAGEPGCRRSRCPKPEPAPESLDAVVAARRSTREYAETPLPLAQLSTLLRRATASPARSSPQPFRAVPSGGALYPLELYVAAQRVERLEPALYHFDPLRAVLERLRPSGRRARGSDPVRRAPRAERRSHDDLRRLLALALQVRLARVSLRIARGRSRGAELPARRDGARSHRLSGGRASTTEGSTRSSGSTGCTRRRSTSCPSGRWARDESHGSHGGRRRSSWQSSSRRRSTRCSTTPCWRRRSESAPARSCSSRSRAVASRRRRSRRSPRDGSRAHPRLTIKAAHEEAVWRAVASGFSWARSAVRGRLSSAHSCSQRAM